MKYKKVLGYKGIRIKLMSLAKTTDNSDQKSAWYSTQFIIIK